VSYPRTPDRRDWLSLGPASRLVGVDPDTLRRWADEGRVVAFTTPGGHRRFDQQSLEQIVSARKGGARRPLAMLGATPARLTRAYKRSYAGAVGQAPTHADIGTPDREAYRQDGRQLVAALLAYLDATDRFERSREEASAAALTDDLARRLAAAGTSLTDSVALFVAARRPFMTEIGRLGSLRALDSAALSTVYEDATGLLDRLLLRLVATHQDVSR
jgi:MerR HTH family regulatory protein